MRILGISGSLRKQSFNTALLHAACELAPDGVSIEPFDLAPIPLYNDDVRLRGYPADVTVFREAIRTADAVLISMPEYNFSMSGVLKNAIDWASRPPDQPCAGKPVAIMGASGGPNGTARGQYHLRQVLLGVDMLAVNRPEIFVRHASEKFDASGALIDEQTRALVKQLVAALVAWTHLVGKP
jgi:chromate reductase